MPRYRIIVEYDGRDFVGWQHQENGLSVQQAIEDALEKFSSERITIHAAGRTDSGVHAMGQVAHFDIERDFDTETVRNAINFHLKPLAVAVLSAEIAADDFHSRFKATSRVYLYRILNRRSPPVLDRGRVWWVSRQLDVEAMNEAAKTLLGKHDFTSFRNTHCQAKSPVKTLDVLEVRRNKEEILITAEARSFLHNQVRNMVGTLKLVGIGKWTPKDVKNALEAHDRAAAGPLSPPDGLYLMKVRY